MNGTTTPKTDRRNRGVQMADYKAVVKRKASDPELSTAAAVRQVAKSRRKSRASVQAAYYAMCRLESQQGAIKQVIAPTIKQKVGKKKAIAASDLVKQSIASTLQAIDRLEKENIALRSENEAMRARLAQIKNCF